MSCDVDVVNASSYQRLQAGCDPALRSERLASAQTGAEPIVLNTSPAVLKSL